MTTNDVDLRFLVMREKYPAVYKRARDAVLEGHRLHVLASEVWDTLPHPQHWQSPVYKPYRKLRYASDSMWNTFHALYSNRHWLRSLGSRKYIIDKWAGGHP